MTVPVGVVGAGVMGADHVRLLPGHVSDAEVVAVTDVDEARSRAVADAVPGARVSRRRSDAPQGARGCGGVRLRRVGAIRRNGVASARRPNPACCTA
ncbi:Gfo/Idh/MocA family oxidoreductase [Streptomyces sp. bgisy034]|uniref:Gfo/Idh/MocA family oxidoreductase n=1 Tax=Streptomyces sp. bgisy034 TaxID=3413774 RepID=UPI003EBD4F39